MTKMHSLSNGAALGPAEESVGPSPLGFELLEEVGRGGMGVIYRALDLVLEREVAVKVLQEKYGPDSDAAARFLDEARITAQLQHPSIPAVYEVGALDDCRPFMAMKLIKGETLDRLLKSNHPLDALAVFEHVCQAVGYAHAHTVVHRDLKPQNVMVGAFGEVQVMDWGLAKVLQSPPTSGEGDTDFDPEATTPQTEIRPLRGSDSTLTKTGSLLGTPAFMAPEQAAGETAKIDARTDVFGLGGILCVLLTGKPPFEGKDADDVRLNAVRGQAGPAFARLDRSAADPGVVALCKRCLAFDRNERPASASEVAAAIAALRRSAEERLQHAAQERLVAEANAKAEAKRRRTFQRAAALVAAVLLLGIMGTSGGLLWANRARGAAVAAKDDAEASQLAADRKRIQAEAARADADAVLGFVQRHILAAAKPKGVDGGLGKDVSLRDAIAASLPEIEKSFRHRPLVEAHLRTTISGSLSELGDVQPAGEQFLRAKALYLAKLGPNAPDTLSSMHNLALIYGELGRLEEAVKLQEEVTAARKRVLAPEDLDALRGEITLGSLYGMVGRYADAVRLYEETLAECRRRFGGDDPFSLDCMHNLALAYGNLGRREEARKLHEQLLAVHQRTLPPDHPSTLASLDSLGSIELDLGRRTEAVKLFEEALEGYRRALPADHPSTLGSMNNLALAYRALNRYVEAADLQAKVLAARRRVHPPDHSDTLKAMGNLAATYADLGRYVEAIDLEKEWLAACNRALPPDHPETSSALHNLARSYAYVGRTDDALRLAEEALAARKRSLPADHPDVLHNLSLLATIYLDANRRDDARKAGEAAAAGAKRTLGPEHPAALEYGAGLADLYRKTGRHADALRLHLDTLATARRALLEEHSITLSCMHGLAKTYAVMGRNDEATKVLGAVLAARRRLPKDHPSTQETLVDLAKIYGDSGRRAEAVKLLEEAMPAFRRGYPQDHPNRLSCQHNLAFNLHQEGRHAEALDLFEEALAARSRVLTRNHPETRSTFGGVLLCLQGLNRGAEAIGRIDEFLANVPTGDLAWTLGLLNMRTAYFRKAGDPAGCRRSAELCAAVAPADATVRYDVACHYAIASAAQAGVASPESPRLAREDADRAMDWLRKAVAAGYRDRVHMAKDDDLSALRGRNDFKKLLEAIPTSAPSAKAPKHR